MAAAPIDLNEYRLWLKRTFGYDDDEPSRRYYSTVVQTLRSAFLASHLWASLMAELKESHDAYYVERRSVLLLNLAPVLDAKEYDPFLLKTYRRNVLNNPNWPDAPVAGWTEPRNWYTVVPDLVRTLLVVKYLDGVPYLAHRLADFGESRGFNYDVSLEARTEGYYAAHAQFAESVEIPERDWRTLHVDARLEVQITTQLQEVMRSHLHRYYVLSRGEPAPDPTSWQWDYQSPEFSVGYLGHTLHYLEGKLAEIRDSQEDK